MAATCPSYELHQQLAARGRDGAAPYHAFGAGAPGQIHCQHHLPPPLAPLGLALGHAGAGPHAGQGSLRNVHDLLQLALANGGLPPSTAHLPLHTQALLCGQHALPAGLAPVAAHAVGAAPHAHAVPHFHGTPAAGASRTPSPTGAVASIACKHHNDEEHSDSDLSSTSTYTHSSGGLERRLSGLSEPESRPAAAPGSAKNTIFPRRKAGQKARVNSQPVVLNMETLSQVACPSATNPRPPTRRVSSPACDTARGERQRMRGAHDPMRAVGCRGSTRATAAPQHTQHAAAAPRIRRASR